MERKVKAKALLIKARIYEKKGRELRETAYDLYPELEMGGRPTLAAKAEVENG